LILTSTGIQDGFVVWLFQIISSSSREQKRKTLYTYKQLKTLKRKKDENKNPSTFLSC